MTLKLIPHTQGFMADLEGNIYNPDGTIRQTYRNSDGYKTVAVKLTDDRWVTFGVHRLVALTFLNDQMDFGRTEVNHRDMSLDNNAAGNLEWVSSKENNIHSEIMRIGNLYPTLIATFDNGNQKLYLNAHDAGVDNDIGPLDVWDSLKNSKIINGIKFEHRPFSGAIPDITKRTTGMFKGMDGKLKSRPIKMFDTDTGEIAFYDSIGKAAIFHGVGPSHIYQSLSSEKYLRLFKKRYQIVYQDQEFPEMDVEFLKKAKLHGPREVYAFNKDTGKAVIYSSAKEFITDQGLSKKAVTKALAQGRLRVIDGWVATYLTKENVEKVHTYVNSPVIA